MSVGSLIMSCNGLLFTCTMASDTSSDTRLRRGWTFHISDTDQVRCLFSLSPLSRFSALLIRSISFARLMSFVGFGVKIFGDLKQAGSRDEGIGDDVWSL